MTPSRKARMSSGSSMTPPRDVLMIKAVLFIPEKNARSNILSVSWVSGVWMEMTSEFLQRSGKSVKVTQFG